MLTAWAREKDSTVHSGPHGGGGRGMGDGLKQGEPAGAVGHGNERAGWPLFSAGGCGTLV